ncbi:hypothetical protein KUTeg_000121 [Tegillarca granosa]|uniref:AB hydrolase-1 domain-containing protein n=1 Tax=Tegillarca granosa TaxID=220873 RepID=A0ABQ9FWP0_TEGGR|nr:hypothetical protein KUTeg_000121 [Tegillarca granosa]
MSSRLSISILTVVFNNRGNGGAKLTPRTYCAADTEDLQFIVSQIKQRYPDAPFIGVGVSLGGMILFNYLAKTGDKCGLEAGMIVSVAWNVFESVLELEKPGINRHASTIREFDDRFTAKMFGYDSWEAYYKEACLHDKVHALKVPVLCLNAADDPFSPKHAVPLKEAEENDNIAIILTSRGGHIGFMEGLIPRHANYMDRNFC